MLAYKNEATLRYLPLAGVLASLLFSASFCVYCTLSTQNASSEIQRAKVPITESGAAASPDRENGLRVQRHAGGAAASHVVGMDLDTGGTPAPAGKIMVDILWGLV